MTHVRKAVIPAAGLGTRFLPATKAQPKEMLPVVDKPAIQYVVEEAVRSGIDDILIITGRGKKAIEDHFDRSVELEHDLHAKGKDSLLAEVLDLANLADIHYVRQGEALGLGHAVATARKHVGDQPFAVMLGDDIMDEHSTVLSEMIDAHEATGRGGGHRVQALPARGDQRLRLHRLRGGRRRGCSRCTSIVEKPTPEDAPSTWGVMGRYVFTPAIFESIDRTKPGAGGEIQLTDAIGGLLPDLDVYGYTFDEGRYDIGSKLDYLRATVELALAREDLGPEFRAVAERLRARAGHRLTVAAVLIPLDEARRRTCSSGSARSAGGADADDRGGGVRAGRGGHVARGRPAVRQHRHGRLRRAGRRHRRRHRGVAGRAARWWPRSPPGHPADRALAARRGDADLHRRADARRRRRRRDGRAHDAARRRRPGGPRARRWPPGEAVRAAGDDLRVGDPVFAPGEVITRRPPRRAGRDRRHRGARPPPAARRRAVHRRRAGRGRPAAGAGADPRLEPRHAARARGAERLAGRRPRPHPRRRGGHHRRHHRRARRPATR